MSDSHLSKANSKKIAAGLCGILLGCLGIHKFVLGYNQEGIIYLLISLLGGVITCGVSTGVMSIIGLVEGIVYLTRTDQQFYDEYISQKKGWF